MISMQMALLAISRQIPMSEMSPEKNTGYIGIDLAPRMYSSEIS